MIRQKKRNVSGILMGVFLVLIMVGSIAGIIGVFNAETPSNVVTYNNIKFTKDENGVFARIDGVDYGFVFDPTQLESFVIPTNFSSWGSYSKVYLSGDPLERISVAFQEFNRFRPTYGISQALPSCPVDSDSCASSNYPIKSCSDASSSVAVIVLVENTSYSSSFENNCLTISGSVVDAAMYFDRAAYENLGILQ